MPPPNKPPPSAPPNKNTERNEYIPSFISKKPFYIDDATASDSDYLEHQRLQSLRAADSLGQAQWYERGAPPAAPPATKFRKGACANCGAASHAERHCLERTRKAGAKWTGRGIAPDQPVQHVSLGWDAKRDRWNGFRAEEYGAVVREWEEGEVVRRGLAADAQARAVDDGAGLDGADGGDRYEEEADMGRTQSSSTRNLRLREDTAKYLLNLDLDGARYDPKTRSMLEAGASGGGRDGEVVAEEGLARAAGGAAEFEDAQRYAWETQRRGDAEKVHLQANPTAGEVERKRKREEDGARVEAKRRVLVERYGAQEGVQRRGAGVEQSEVLVEYDEGGRVKGVVERRERSVYAEDVLVNNHTAVWGSWWRDFTWGYACCRSVVRNSYCTGEEGRRAGEEAERCREGGRLPEADGWREEEGQGGLVPNAAASEQMLAVGGEARTSTLAEMRGGVSAELMELYRRNKVVKDDPMARMMELEAQE